MKKTSQLILILSSLLAGQTVWADSKVNSQASPEIKAKAERQVQTQCYPSSARHGVRYRCVTVDVSQK